MSEWSEWQELLDSFTKAATKSRKLDEFFLIKNDNARRVQFLLQDEDARELLIRWINYHVKKVKDVELSRSLRISGNHQFKIKEYPACINTYTKSILCCPEECKEELSLALANRSAALFHLGLHEDSLTDINGALLNGYPTNLLHKILMRKAQCLLNLSSKGYYQEELEKLEDAMKSLHMKDQAKIRAETEAFSASVQQCDENLAEEIPTPLGGENPDIRGASSALEIKYSKEKGRYVVANRAIKAGETLFVEKPSTLVVLPDFHQSRCHHCTLQFTAKAYYPCLQCASVWFCSQTCREESIRCYHRFECGFNDVLTSVGIAHLGLRIVLTFGLDAILDFIRNQNDKVPGIDGTPYDTSSYAVLFHLTSHTELMAAEELLQYSLTAAFLTLLMERHTSFFASATSDEISTIGGLILVHICQMVSNAHAVTKLCLVDDHNEKQERIATAIYPSASLMNHSCDPTVINSFQGSRLIVRSIRDVSKGEEVYNCYGPHYRRMRRPDRVKALELQYCFTCQCKSCGDVDVEDFQDLLYSFQCPSCQGSLVNPKVSHSQMTQCRSCGTQQSYFTQLKSDLEAVSLDDRGTEAMEQGDIIQAVKLLTKCVQLRSKSLFRGHPDLGKSADKLAQCHAFLGNYEECEKMLKISLTAVEYQFGRYSIEMANELQKYTDVLLELLEQGGRLAKLEQDLLTHLEEMALTYQIHYGLWSKNYKEVTLKMERVNRSIASSK